MSLSSRKPPRLPFSSEAGRCGGVSATIAATARAALVTGATLASALAMVSKARAANWDFNPFVEAGGRYNDNYRMAEVGAPKTKASGSLIEAEFAMRLLDPRADISIVP